jgi:methionine synthase II (cobalamin-independent)
VNKVLYIFLFFFLVGKQFSFAQITNDDLIITKDSTKTKTKKPIVYDPLRPSKAAFYSALVPGLGQAYNKKYWKIPIVYGAMGASMYFYLTNNKKYHEVRDAYKRRLAGFSDDDFQYLDNDRLILAQRFYQRNRDLSLLVTVAFYVLNIVDANVDAHLLQFNVSDKLSIVPDLQQNDITTQPNLGLSLNFKF